MLSSLDLASSHEAAAAAAAAADTAAYTYDRQSPSSSSPSRSSSTAAAVAATASAAAQLRGGGGGSSAAAAAAAAAAAFDSDSSGSDPECFEQGVHDHLGAGAVPAVRRRLFAHGESCVVFSDAGSLQDAHGGPETPAAVVLCGFGLYCLTQPSWRVVVAVSLKHVERVVWDPDGRTLLVAPPPAVRGPVLLRCSAGERRFHLHAKLRRRYEDETYAPLPSTLSPCCLALAARRGSLADAARARAAELARMRGARQGGGGGVSAALQRRAAAAVEARVAAAAEAGQRVQHMSAEVEALEALGELLARAVEAEVAGVGGGGGGGGGRGEDEGEDAVWATQAVADEEVAEFVGWFGEEEEGGGDDDDGGGGLLCSTRLGSLEGEAAALGEALQGCLGRVVELDEDVVAAEQALSAAQGRRGALRRALHACDAQQARRALAHVAAAEADGRAAMAAAQRRRHAELLLCFMRAGAAVALADQDAYMRRLAARLHEVDAAGGGAAAAAAAPPRGAQPSMQSPPQAPAAPRVAVRQRGPVVVRARVDLGDLLAGQKKGGKGGGGGQRSSSQPRRAGTAAAAAAAASPPALCARQRERAAREAAPTRREAATAALEKWHGRLAKHASS